MLIGTHAHPYLKQFNNDCAAMLQRADTEGQQKAA